VKYKFIRGTGSSGAYSLVTYVESSELLELSNSWSIDNKVLTELIDEKLEKLVPVNQLKPRT
jgi:hypothetical protein